MDEKFHRRRKSLTAKNAAELWLISQNPPFLKRKTGHFVKDRGAEQLLRISKMHTLRRMCYQTKPERMLKRDNYKI